MASHLQNWELPRISKSEIYQTSIFNYKKNYSIKTIEGTVLLQNEQEPIQLFDSSVQYSGYEFLHIGCVQVGIKPLTREVRDTSVLLCLRDNRMRDFNASLLSVLESNLAEGPVHFNCFPNFMVSLKDPNILRVLTLYVKFQNLEMKEGSFPFVLLYRICYKCMKNPPNPASKKSSPINRTTFYQKPIRAPNMVVSRTIRWSDVQFPEEWELQEEIPQETQGYESPKRIDLHGQSAQNQSQSRNSSKGVFSTSSRYI